MGCIQTDQAKIKATSLLTKDEKLETLVTGFGHKYRNHGKLFIPSDSFYTQVAVDEDQLRLMVTELLHWLGVKHTGLVVGFSDSVESTGKYTAVNKRHQIALPESSRASSFVCGSLLAHQIMHYYLFSKKKLLLTEEQENEAFTELACIQAGLGLVLLNGRKDPEPIIVQDLRLYIDTHAVAPSQWSSASKKQLRKLLGYRRRPVQLKAYVAASEHNQIIKRDKLILLIVCGVVITSAIIFVWSQRPRSLPASLQEKRETIDLLRFQYDRCLAEIERQRDRFKDSDTFTDRAIEADQSRCTSIKNQYNYQVDLYNTALEKL